MGNPRHRENKRRRLYKTKEDEAAVDRRAVLKRKLADKHRRDEQDVEMGFDRYTSGPPRLGWMLNMHETIAIDNETGQEITAIDCYMLEEDGSTFKATFTAYPYVYVSCKDELLVNMEGWLKKRYSYIKDIEHSEKVDLDLNNHLLGNHHTFLKIIFNNKLDLQQFTRKIRWIVARNRSSTGMATYANTFTKQKDKLGIDMERELTDLREYDVEFITRMCIDYDLRVGKWFEATPGEGGMSYMKPRNDLEVPPDAIVLAFDIETCKSPLKFPKADRDQIMMISYMVDKDGFLITNREVVAEDIEDFEYTPKPEYEGVFTIFNEPNEKALLERFFEHIKDVCPNVYATYNGDFFDWPYIRDRAQIYGIDMEEQIGVVADRSGVFGSRFAVHIDCFNWVQRDSYLPQGAQGLKNVTRYKLGYDPVELDPEDMEPFARTRPQELATYSVSDAVATYYLFKKYVQAFIFSLCVIIPLNSGDVLRKGSGTLCEALLMVQAYKKNIICPNKQKETDLQWYKGKLLDSETYIGGHVECFESGIFREDIKYKFALDSESYQKLIDDVDETIKFFITVEAKMKVEEITNIEEVKAEIIKKLEYIRDNPRCEVTPLIYHLDVAAMYPNIILTNRLQPVAIVDKAICAACDFNRPGSKCQRALPWRWRGKYYPATKGEVSHVRNALEVHEVPKAEIPNYQPPWGQEDDPNVKTVHFSELKKEQKNALVKKRTKEYSQKVYRKQTVTIEENRYSTVCQRENGFYVDTVKAFRDRRYTYKGLTRKWKGHLKEAVGEMNKIEAAKMVTLYDSLQLAHKCILNSFYGYVMRKGARWYSMPMAAITTHIGGTVIKMAHLLCEKIGRPLELDTDGIWTLMPGIFPEEFELYTTNPKKKKITLEYPGSMLNLLTHRVYTNDQFQELTDPVKKTYSLSKECSIFFEVDGPYLAMILPASTQEGKKLKKRYAVYNRDKSLAELKGFEIKRRGELNLIKYFQKEIFKTFLLGSSLQTIYQEVGSVAKRFLDVIDTKGCQTIDEDLFDLIMENKNMSKSLEEYGGARGTSLTCAKRLAQFLGPEVLEGGGLQCKFIISAEPSDASVSDRAVPVEIFKAEPALKLQFLRKWLRNSSMTAEAIDIRNIIDWAYYRRRVGANIQKIVTIPAAMQRIDNPLPQLAHPPWLSKVLREMNDPYQQRSIKGFFKKSSGPTGVKSNSVRPKTQNSGATGSMDLSMNVESLPESLGSLSTPMTMDVDEDVGVVLEAGENTLPANNDSVEDWLSRQKDSWKALNKKRSLKRRKQAEDDIKRGRTVKKAKHGTGINAYIKKKIAELYQSEWQIVQIAPTNIPGTFLLWVFLNKDTLQRIRVVVKREFYINTNGGAEILRNKGGMKCNRQLPRDRECLELFQMRMDEFTFRSSQGSLNLYMMASHVEGVYELHVDPLFRAVASIGCVTQVGRRVFKKDEHNTEGFDLTELDYKEIPTTRSGYLSNVQHSTAFLYYSQNANGRGLMAFFQEEEDREWLAYLVAINPFDGVIKEIPVQQIVKILENEIGESAPIMRSELVQVRTLGEAASYMSAHIEKYNDTADGLGGPTIVISQTVLELQDLYLMLPPLPEEFPVVCFPFVWEDNDYPALQWYSFALRRALASFIQSPMYFQKYCEFARYLHCPIGNLPKDAELFALDVFFSRHLKDANHIWWASKGPRPDLGGQEEDENLFEDEHKNPEIINPGVHHTICVEINLNYLHITAILKSDEITQIEVDPRKYKQAGLEGAGDEHVQARSRYTFDDSSACRKSFNVLRTLTQTLVESAGEGHEQAESLVNELYRWLHSPSAYLYDPLLHKYVHKLMKKVFVQLLTQLRNLGAKIIYASFNKIIIDTGKTTILNAASFIRYSTETLNAEESLFTLLQFHIVQFWGYLTFLDPANFGGYKIILREEQQQSLLENETEGVSLEDANYEKLLDMDWNIKEYLPKGIQDNFTAIIGNYIQRFYLKFVELAAEKKKLEDQGIQIAGSEELHHQFGKHRKDILENELMPNMYKIIEDVHERFPPDSTLGAKSSGVFPQLPGSHLPLHSPGLEFVKYIARILELDETIHTEVQLFKRNALKLVGSREFTKGTQFANPCATHILPDMVCANVNCRVARDLDVCREREWKCSTCDFPYDPDVIEQRLVEAVQRKNMAFQVQDLKCSRCGMVKACLMQEYCECSGPWTSKHSPEDFLKEIKKFMTIAKYHNFEWLTEVSSWIAKTVGMKGK